MNEVSLNFDARMELARAGQTAGHLLMAELDYRAAWALRPDDAEAPLELANVLVALGKKGEALETLHITLARNPDHYAAHYKLAQLFNTEGDHATALAHYQQALRLKPGSPSILSTIALKHIALGQHEDAKAILTGLIETRPDWDRPYRYLARSAQAQGRPEEAVEHLLLAVQRQPDDEALIISLAAALRQVGRLDEAETWLNGLDWPDSGQVWNQRGHLALCRDETEAALNCFRAGQRAEPTHPACYRDMLAKCLGLGLLKEAEATLAAARQQLPDDGRIDGLEIRLLRARGRYEDAQALAARLVGAHPEAATGWQALIELHISLGQWPAAEDALCRMPTPHPTQAQAKALFQARLAQARYDIDEALRQIAIATILAPPNTALLQQKTILELMQGDGLAARVTLLERRKLLEAQGSPHTRGGLLHDLMNELRMNPFAQGELSRIHRLPGADRLPALVKLLTEEPDYPGTGVSLLLALRQRGGMEPRAHGSATGASRIPRFVVQFWDSARPPADILEHLLSWPVANPGFEHQVFNDTSAEAFIARHCDAEVLTAFRMAGLPSVRADLFRLAFLTVHGGIYADADDHCRHGIAAWLKPGVELLLYQEDWGALGNNFLAAVPNHPFLRHALATAADNILNRQWGIRLVSGPDALTTVFSHFYAGILELGQRPAGVEILEAPALRLKISPHLPRARTLGDRPWEKPPETWVALFRPPRPYHTDLEDFPDSEPTLSTVTAACGGFS